jgi:putative DNA primase/helicase
MTKAKKDLIELGLKPPERFVREWLNGYLPLPLQVCSAGQLYRAFKHWCGQTGERFPPAQEHFTKTVEKTVALLSSRLPDKPVLLIYKVVKLDDPVNGKRASRMWIPGGSRAPIEMTEGKWAAREMAEFEAILSEFCGRAGTSGP